MHRFLGALVVRVARSPRKPLARSSVARRFLRRVDGALDAGHLPTPSSFLMRGAS